jgi:putative redox protein
MAITFKNIFGATQEALRQAPDQAQVSFEATTQLGKGLRSAASIRQFNVAIDEPESLGGTDTAPNPVELVLAALGSCQEISYRLYADALGIPLRKASVKVRGDIDLRGFFAVDPSIRPGFLNIEAVVTLDSPAPEADLIRLKEAVDRHCPVLDILRSPVPVTLELARANQSSKLHTLAPQERALAG